MKIAEIKITDELMNALVTMLFAVEQINNERTIENAIPQELRPYGSNIKPIPRLNMTVKAVLNISKEDVKRYWHAMQLLNGSMTSSLDYPYISLVSDNANNDLQVYINQCSDDVVTYEDISVASLQWMDYGDGRYTFYNRHH